MNSLFRGANELKMGSSILTRDANAPESPQEAIPRDWHVGISAPQLLENLGKCPKHNSKKHEKHIFEI